MSGICTIITDGLLLALTPVQRWEAARRLDNSLSLQQWIVIIGLSGVAIALAVYVFIRIKRKGRGGGAEDAGSFAEQASQKGLSSRETQILLYVAKMAGLKSYRTIFAMKKAFDLGAAMLIREVPSTTGMSAERVEQLVADLTSLREKLGFQQSDAEAGGSAGPLTGGLKPSSRKIPVGKRLYINRRIGREGSEIEATVIENSDAGITVRLPMEVRSPAGEQWRVRYFYGASVWEFDVPVVRAEADTIVFGHSEQIRFINRRRFHRVAVSRKGYVASFPFDKEISSYTPAGSGKDVASNDKEDDFASGDILPGFVPAVVTELAGPGLRIETSLELEVSERVAVVFEVESSKQNAGYAKQDKKKEQDKKTDLIKRRIIQSVGEVRHVEQLEKGFSVAVELTGLSDAYINELIRATNAASVESSRQERQEAEQMDGEQAVTADDVEEAVAEAAR